MLYTGSLATLKSTRGLRDDAFARVRGFGVAGSLLTVLTTRSCSKRRKARLGSGQSIDRS